MANLKYNRSANKERLIVNLARQAGMESARSAGSKSARDLWIWDKKDKVIRFVQVKTKKGARHMIQKDRKVHEGYTIIEATYSWE